MELSSRMNVDKSAQHTQLYVGKIKDDSYMDDNVGGGSAKEKRMPDCLMILSQEL
jgi:hypothetical protein